MTDIVERLRAADNIIASDAADQIELLRKLVNANGVEFSRLIEENERLRGTLIEMRLHHEAAGRSPEDCYEMEMIDKALKKMSNTQRTQNWIKDSPWDSMEEFEEQIAYEWQEMKKDPMAELGVNLRPKRVEVVERVGRWQLKVRK